MRGVKAKRVVDHATLADYCAMRWEKGKCVFTGRPCAEEDCKILETRGMEISESDRKGNDDR